MRSGRLASAFPNEKAAARAGTWFAAVAEAAWAIKRNELPMTRAAGEGTNILGGFLAPQEISARIIELRDTRGVFRRNTTVEPMKAETDSVPRRTGGLTAYFTAEGAAATESNATWDNVNLVAKKLAVLCRTSNELQEDAAASFGETISREIAYAMAAKEDDVGFNGTGVQADGGIRGVTRLLIDNGHNAGKVTATAGHDLLSEIDAVDLANLVGALPNFATARACWFISPLGFALVFCRLSSGNGGIIMMEKDGRTVPTFWGFEIVITSSLPNVGTTLANSIMLLFGDFAAASTLGERRGIEIAQSTARYMDLDQILWRGRERLDIVNHDLGDNTTAGPVVGLLAG
jgi:HK97 family phage major capsid protein